MAEIELKLEIPRANRKAFLTSGVVGESAGSVRQQSVYFDTNDRTLFKKGFTLRVRRSGDARMQTVKATGKGVSLFARSEWETPIVDDLPVLESTSPIATEFGLNSTDVSPQFKVSVERHIWNVKENSSQIEAVLDEGTVIAGDRQTSICEIELELKDGDARDLFVLARKFEAVAPVKFGVQSKAERGYWLMEAAKSAVKAEAVELGQATTAISAFQTIAQSCFRQFRLNETILLRGKSAEALHQARVAIRRLRSAFSLFKVLVLDGEAGRLSDEFRWLAHVLGEARNLDVLLPKAQNGELRRKLGTAQEHAYDDAFDALKSPRASALMLDFNEWLHCGDYLRLPARQEERERSAEGFASEALDKMRKKIKKHGRDLLGVDDEQRHQVRKDAKKLRYAAEFFGPLFTEKRSARRHKHFIAAMERLQDQLGTLNDLVIGPDVLEKHGLRSHPEAETLVSHANKTSLIEEAQSCLDDVLDTKRFWR
ncbi:CHAD domain-containing protein [Rhizobium jaguaris]|uniref:Inorganic triphosphatase n=1 Tax=Rhizobium jaguaris TaxID=1312183 RepID=A0A387G0N2_9HYPH|nr:CHAD domain-containing protein [Rhizobium jaguaris]AYG63407.1 inorganic triphosphatase [Rhizobium jaguaris]